MDIGAEGARSDREAFFAADQPSAIERTTAISDSSSCSRPPRRDPRQFFDKVESSGTALPGPSRRPAIGGVRT